MPNWVRTKITFPNISNVHFVKIVNKFCDENETLDFEKIIPMPSNIYRGNLGEAEERKYGKNNWYDWSTENWGTKWNASDGEVDFANHSIIFSTAWSFAEPVIRELASLTKCSIEAIYADEDFGNNAGRYTFDADGNVECCAEDEDGIWEIIEELWGVTREDFTKPEEEVIRWGYSDYNDEDEDSYDEDDNEDNYFYASDALEKLNMISELVDDLIRRLEAK